jgi:hypothetical protein
MEALLDKYADQGLEILESPDVLKVIPFPQMGTPSSSSTPSVPKNNTPPRSVTSKPSSIEPAELTSKLMLPHRGF